MKIKCINTGATNNISINTEYEVIRELDNQYTILNNKGVQKNYNKKLFEVILEEIPVTEVESYKVETSFAYNEDEPDGEIFFDIYINNNHVLVREIYVTFPNSQISCGIDTLSGVLKLSKELHNSLKELNNYIEENRLTYKDDLTSEKIIQETLESIIKDIKDTLIDEVGMLLMSTNINGDDVEEYEYLFDIFRNKADSVIKTHNPNSGNDIELWIYKIG